MDSITKPLGGWALAGLAIAAICGHAGLSHAGESTPNVKFVPPQTGSPTFSPSLNDKTVGIHREQDQLEHSLGDLAQTAFEQASEAHLQRQYPEAIQLYSEAIDLNPNDAKAYAARAGIQGQLQNYQAAIADYDQALQLAPNLAAAYGGRSIAHRANGNLTAAAKDLWQAAQIFYSEGNEGAYLTVLTLINQLAP